MCCEIVKLVLGQAAGIQLMRKWEAEAVSW